MEDKDLDEIKILSKKIRRKILDLSHYAGASSSHFGGALSSVEIIATLFGKIMNFDKDNYKDVTRDRFILSKGHGCLVYYSILNILNIISDDQLKTFEKDNSKLLGHPVKNQELGIDFSTGSLGMGFSLATGVAIALKKKKLSNKVFVLIGDGECNEGSIWETALSAPNLNLDNLTVIIDNNSFQQTGSNQEIMDIGDLEKKWSSFNWITKKIDGHNPDEIFNALKPTDEKLPKVLICKTVKGKGFSFSENNNDWHHKIMSKDNYDLALKELEND
jgi:transketolase